MATVFTNGCFDILHPGHFQLLAYCRYLAGSDQLIVAIDSDAKVAKDKGIHRPYFSAQERCSLLMMMTSDGRLDEQGFGHFLIDWVETFDTNQQLRQLIEWTQPDYIIKGTEWKGKHVVGSDLATVHYAPTYFKEFCSTTMIEKRILENNLVK